MNKITYPQHELNVILTLHLLNLKTRRNYECTPVDPRKKGVVDLKYKTGIVTYLFQWKKLRM